MKTIAVIPARGGSKGIEKKNIYPLLGYPLIYYTIKSAKLSEDIFDRVIVSTDDEQIAEISKKYGAEVISRPAHLSTDTSKTQDVLLHTVSELNKENYNIDLIMTLQPTSPLRTSKHIHESIKLFKENPNADSLVSCLEVPHIYHPRSVMELSQDGYLKSYSKDKSIITRRQDKSRVFARNGAAIYITKASKLDEYIFGGNLLPYIMAKEDSIDIDTLEDLKLAESILISRLSNS